MSKYLHKRNYGQFKGIDLSSSKISLSDPFVETMQDCAIEKGTSDLVARKGLKRIGRDYSSDPQVDTDWPDMGLFKYNRRNPTTGEVTEELLSFNAGSGKLYRLDIESALQFTLVGASPIYLSVIYDTATSVHRFQLRSVNDESAAPFFNIALESTGGTQTVTVADLINDIPLSIPGFISAVTLVGDDSANIDTSIPALSLLPIVSLLRLAGATDPNNEKRRLYLENWQAVEDTGVDHLEGWRTVGESLDNKVGQLPTYTNLNDNLYITTGFDPIWKYDGRLLTRAGHDLTTRTMSQDAITKPAGAPFVNGKFAFIAEFNYVDSNDGLVRSRAVAQNDTESYLDNSSGFVPNVTLYPPAALADETGFNMTNATIDGDQVFTDATLATGSFTIDVDGGHGIRIGDLATFNAIATNSATPPTDLDGIKLLVQSRVTAVSATTITVKDEAKFIHVLGGQKYGYGGGPVDIFTPSSTGVYTPNELLDIIGSADAWSVLIDTKLSDLHDLGTLSVNVKLHLDNGAIISSGAYSLTYRTRDLGVGTGIDLTSDPGPYYLVDKRPLKTNSADTFKSFIRNLEEGPLASTLPGSAAGPFTNSLLKQVSAEVKGRYIDAHQERLYVAGDPADENTLYRSDILDGPEFFDPFGSANLSLDTREGARIVGIRGLQDSFFIVKNQGIMRISGDLGTNTNIRVQEINSDFACLPHLGIQRALNALVIPTTLGPIIMDVQGSFKFLGSAPEGSRSRIERVFSSIPENDLTRVTSVVNSDEGYYAIFIPESPSRIQSFSEYAFNYDLTLGSQNSDDGVLYLYDFTRDAWMTATNINATGGIVTRRDLKLNREVLYAQRFGPVTTGSSNYAGWTQRQNTQDSRFSYIDEIHPIKFKLTSRWEDLNSPLVHKKGIRVKLYQMGDIVIQDNDPIYTCETRCDWDPSSVDAQFFLEPTGDGLVVEDQASLNNTRVVSMQLDIQMTEPTQKAAISGIELEMAAPFKERISTSDTE